MPEKLKRQREAADIAAIILAGGLVIAVIVITTSVLVNTFQDEGAGLGENTTQVLLTCLGGILALLGSFIGYAFGRRAAVNDENRPENHTIAPYGPPPPIPPGFLGGFPDAPIPPPTPPPPPPRPDDADEAETQIDWPERENNP